MLYQQSGYVDNVNPFTLIFFPYRNSWKGGIKNFPVKTVINYDPILIAQ